MKSSTYENELEEIKKDVKENAVRFCDKLKKLLQYSEEKPHLKESLGIFWHTNNSQFWINNDNLSNVLFIKKNSINKNLKMYGFELVKIQCSDIPIEIVPNHKEWKLRENRNCIFQKNSMCTKVPCVQTKMVWKIDDNVDIVWKTLAQKNVVLTKSELVNRIMDELIQQPLPSNHEDIKKIVELLIHYNTITYDEYHALCTKYGAGSAMIEFFKTIIDLEKGRLHSWFNETIPYGSEWCMYIRNKTIVVHTIKNDIIIDHPLSGLYGVILESVGLKTTNSLESMLFDILKLPRSDNIEFDHCNTFTTPFDGFPDQISDSPPEFINSSLWY